MLKNDNTQYLKVCKKEKHTGFPSGSVSKESTCNAGNLSSIPRSGRSPGEGNGYPFQKNRNYNTIFSSVQSLSCVRLCDPMVCSTPGFPVHHQLPNLCPSSQWCHPAISPSVAPSPPAFNLSQHQVFSNESVLCIRWPCRRPGFNPPVRKIPWRRKWQPTPVFLPGKFHGQRSWVSYSAVSQSVQ